MKMSHTRIKILLTALLCVFAMFLFGCDKNTSYNSDSKSSIAKDQSVLRIAATAGNEPFEYRDDDGALLGLDMAVGMVLAEEMDKKPVFEDVSYDSLLDGLNTGIYDIVISALVVSDSLKQQVDFTDDYLSLSSSIVVPKNNTDVTDLKSLKKVKSVAVSRDSVSARYLKDHYGLGNLTEYRNAKEAQNALFNKKSDALFTDDNIAKKIISTYPQYKITSSGIAPSKYSIAVQEGNYELLTSINKIINALEGNGVLSEIRAAYIEGDEDLKDLYNTRLRDIQ